MAKTALELTAEEKRRYRPLAAMRERQAHTATEREQRWQAARAVAAQAAALLREEFGATGVLLFGSAVRPASFTRWSDIDLAVVGIAPAEFFQAVATVGALSSEFQIDLVDPRDCSPGLRLAIEREGIEL